jgi:hypothetical protein
MFQKLDLWKWFSVTMQNFICLVTVSGLLIIDIKEQYEFCVSAMLLYILQNKTNYQYFSDTATQNF